MNDVVKLIKSVFDNNDTFYFQVFLEECCYKLAD